MDNQRTPKDNKYQSYSYVGAEKIKEETDLTIGGYKIVEVEDIKEWIQGRPSELANGTITATFVISEEEELIINGRHTEHIMCAKGHNVLSAGEVIFQLEANEISISEISNQSTGYCPKPASWPIVEMVLAKIGIEYPEGFTNAYDFRYCEACKNINLIKDDVYQCLVCNSDLDLEWNFDKMDLLADDHGND